MSASYPECFTPKTTRCAHCIGSWANHRTILVVVVKRKSLTDVSKLSYGDTNKIGNWDSLVSTVTRPGVDNFLVVLCRSKVAKSLSMPT